MTKSGAIVCLCAGVLGPATSADEDRGATPTYTNADLERMTPYRGETGVLSQPAMPADRTETSKTKERAEGRGESYWRREAERLRERLRPLRQRAAELRQRIQETHSAAGRKPARGGRESAEALEQRLASIEAEMREREDELHERARREGALPGWLR
jgi:hypothetical protein